MKTATVSDLQRDFRLIAKWLAKGESVQITKRGKLMAELTPKKAGELKTLLGATPCPFPLPQDIDDPVYIMDNKRRKNVTFAGERISLKSLVSKVTSENVHPETDWGPPQGKEAW